MQNIYPSPLPSTLPSIFIAVFCVASNIRTIIVSTQLDEASPTQTNDLNAKVFAYKNY